MRSGCPESRFRCTSRRGGVGTDHGELVCRHVRDCKSIRQSHERTVIFRRVGGQGNNCNLKIEKKLSLTHSSGLHGHPVSGANRVTREKVLPTSFMK